MNDYTIALRRERKGWSGGYENPQGGGGNLLTYAGASRLSVIASGLCMVSPGERYSITIAGTKVCEGTKRGACLHAPAANPRGCFFCIENEAQTVLENLSRAAKLLA